MIAREPPSISPYPREEADWEVYKESRNTVKSLLRDAEKDYVRGEVLAHKNNSDSLWKVINNSIRSKGKHIHVYSKDPKSVADDFNQFFSSVGRKSAEAAVYIASVNNIDTNLSMDRHLHYHLSWSLSLLTL